MSNGQQVGAFVGGGIGALVGSMVGMPALGFSIGWTAGSWIGGAVAPEKEQVTEFKAEAFPPFNTAMRGNVIPVLFGTNRVSAQIAWQGGYSVTRNEESTGDGGKGGGSGGGSKGATQTAATYTYKMDMIYHLGLVTAPVSLLGAWVGSQRVDANTINSINAQYENDFDSSDPYTFGEQSFTFDSGVFFPGNLPETQSWSVLTSAIGMDIRWPGTCWVGLEQINLGERPVIPQLSFEVGNSQTGAQQTGSGIIWQVNHGQYQKFAPGNPDIFGNYWVIPTNGIGSSPKSVKVYSPSGALLQTYDVQELIQDLHENITGSLPDSWKYALLASCAFYILGSKLYAYATFNKGLGTDAPLRGSYALFMVATIEANGGYSPSGSCYAFRTITIDGNNCPCFIGPGIHFIDEYPGDDAPIVILGATGGEKFVGQMSPTINQIENLYNGQRVDYVQQRFIENDFDEDFFHNNQSWTTAAGGNNGTSNQFGCILPVGTELYFYAYLSAGLFNGGNNPTFDALWTSQRPNGGLMRFRLSTIYQALLYTGSNTLEVQTMTDPEFVDAFSDGLYFSDDGKAWTDDSQNANAYYTPECYVELLDSGAYLVGWAAPINSDPSYGASLPSNIDVPIYFKFRAYVFNPLTAGMTLFAKAGGTAFMRQELVPTVSGANSLTSPGINQIVLRRSGEELLCYFATATQGDTTASVVPKPRLGQFRFGLLGTLGSDLTPPEIIKPILVNEIVGLYPGRPIIDEASYDAAVDYCVTNNIRVSTQYRTDGRAQNWIERLLAIYDGFLVVDVTAGRIKFGITELSNQSVRTIDNRRLIRRKPDQPPVNTTKGARQDTYNLIRVNYLDRGLDYKQNQVEEGDEVDQDLTGIRVREFPGDFVMNEATARRIANRALWSNLYTRDTHEFYLGWRDADLEPGDVITLVDSFGPVNQVVRISRWEEVERGLFQVNASQILQYVPGVDTGSVNSAYWNMVDWAGVNSVYSNVTSQSTGVALTGAPGLAYAAAYELPAEFTVDDIARVHIGWVPDALAAGAWLYVSADGVTFGRALQAQPYPVYGQILTELPAFSPLGYHESVDVVLYTHNASSLHVNGTLADANISAMHLGASLIWVGSEMLAYTGVTLTGQNRYRFDRVYRGWGGTPAGAHSSGDYMWRQGGGLFAREFGPDLIGQTLIYKVVPYGFNGQEYNVASISARSYTIVGRHYQPLPMSQVEVRSNRGLGKIGVGSTVDVQLDWHNGARMSGYGFGGAGRNPGGWGGFTPDTVQQGWRVNVVGSGGVVVRSTYVSSPTFTYTSSMNYADNGAWRGNCAYVVTPRNSYGDAPASSVLSLELF
jgi:hypothetical protein